MKPLYKIISLAVFYFFAGTLTPAHAIDYFGYYNTSMPGTGNRFHEVADHTNTVWIFQYSNEAVVSDVALAVSLGKKVVLDLNYVFFNSAHRLNADWQTRWNSFVNAVAPYSDSIIAIAPHDEPNLYNIPNTELQTAVTAIHTGLPGKAAIGLFAGTINMSTPMIQIFDWVGFDCYSNGNFQCSGQGYIYKYESVKKAMLPSQRMIIIPQAGLPASNNGCCINNLINENTRLFHLAYGDPQVVGIFPFIWQAFNDGSANWYGLNDYPALQPKVKGIGEAVSTHWSYPPGIVPVYRFWSTNAEHDYFHSRDVTEGVLAASANHFILEGIGFNLYSENFAGTVPLYRCRTQTVHFISEFANCEGNIVEYMLGYSYPYLAENTMPLYRFYNAQTTAHLTTTDYNWGISANFVYERIIGYVPATYVP